MEIHVVEFTKQELQNLLTFLDRVSYKGLTEIQAINTILHKLSNPIEIQYAKEEKSS